MVSQIRAISSSPPIRRLSTPAWKLIMDSTGSTSWLVEGIVPYPAVILVAAPPKSFKSLLVQDLAVSIASGTKFLGELNVPERAPVIYIQDESSKSALLERIEKLTLGHGVHPFTCGEDLRIITNTGFQVLDQMTTSIFETEIRDVGAKLVIFDSLSTMHTNDENSAHEMQPLMDYFRRLRDRCSVTVVVVHHTNKQSGNRSTPNAIRGSNALWAGVDGRIQLTKSKTVAKVILEGKDYEVQNPFSFSPKFGTYSYGLEDGDLLERYDGCPSITFDVRLTGMPGPSTREEDESAPDGYEMVVLRRIYSLGSPTLKDLESATDSNEKSIRTAAKRLESLGLVTISKVKENGTIKNRYFVTDKGKVTLGK